MDGCIYQVWGAEEGRKGVSFFLSSREVAGEGGRARLLFLERSAWDQQGARLFHEYEREMRPSKVSA